MVWGNNSGDLTVEREGKIAYAEEESWRIWGLAPEAALQRFGGATVMGNPGDGYHAVRKSVSPATSYPLPAEPQSAASPQAAVCRCFSLIKSIINTCQSNGPRWEGDFLLIRNRVPQEVLGVWEEHFQLGGIKKPSYKMKKQVVFIWANACEFIHLISVSMLTDARWARETYSVLDPWPRILVPNLGMIFCFAPLESRESSVDRRGYLLLLSPQLFRTKHNKRNISLKAPFMLNYF